jgi:hypothetical protein
VIHNHQDELVRQVLDGAAAGAALRFSFEVHIENPMLTFDEKQTMVVFDRGLYICSCSEVPPHSGNRLALKAAVLYATDTQDRQHPINV